MGMGCNHRRGNLFEGYEAFWIIVVIAIVIIWVHYLCGCGNGNNCGCGNNDGCCNNDNCCNYGPDCCCNSCC